MTATLSSTPSRTQSFSVVLAIELWERFGFYGMQGILLLYMVQRLGFGDAQANLLWGTFSAVTYAAPAIGGWIGDTVLGSRRTMVMGTVVLTLGYALLGLDLNGQMALYVALSVIALGNGLFKANAANLVRRIYEGDDARIDVAFTYYYMSINVGSTVSLLLTPWMQQHYGWGPPFLVCAAGLAFGLACYMLFQSRLKAIGSAPDFQPIVLSRLAAVLGGMVVALAVMVGILGSPSLGRACVWLAASIIAVIWVVLYRRAAPAYRPGLRLAYLLIVQTMLYFVFYQQMVTSLTLFALRDVASQFTLFGVPLFSLSAGQFQALNPVWIMAASPVLSWVYKTMEDRGWNFPIAEKFIVGFSLVALSFLIWWLSAANSTTLVSPWVMFWAYGALSVGELLISALGLAVVARYVPANIGAFMMGSYCVSNGVAMYLGSMVANLAAVGASVGDGGPAVTLPIYADLFRTLFIMAVGCTLVFVVCLPFTRRWDAQHRAAQAAAKLDLAA
ncbi:peptide MFS transporter [Acetobacter cibinongensis]|uniref:Peptide transporter n=1 Tax=Acetobacter cibinongensis TaxID=146475 RepID=A0A1Z5YUK4_9PROT|nr:oligopeptide:H+ symporter [Acetobacter cibinongensis]OUJ02248.1 peptide transporter [Acetobacter cibinongensis]GAN59542.1 di/tripeptide transporter [Acetobacter cibinongensis]GBQ16040.1 amino acid transporter [Acetobacter cibinongensis NRIC 0482]GEL57431.1 POT-family proton dependent transporter [Acetobacter cibinongensis]